MSLKITQQISQDGKIVVWSISGDPKNVSHIGFEIGMESAMTRQKGRIYAIRPKAPMSVSHVAFEIANSDDPMAMIDTLVEEGAVKTEMSDDFFATKWAEYLATPLRAAVAAPAINEIVF